MEGRSGGYRPEQTGLPGEGGPQSAAETPPQLTPKQLSVARRGAAPEPAASAFERHLSTARTANVRPEGEPRPAEPEHHPGTVQVELAATASGTVDDKEGNEQPFLASDTPAEEQSPSTERGGRGGRSEGGGGGRPPTPPSEAPPAGEGGEGQPEPLSRMDRFKALALASLQYYVTGEVQEWYIKLAQETKGLPPAESRQPAGQVETVPAVPSRAVQREVSEYETAWPGLRPQADAPQEVPTAWPGLDGAEAGELQRYPGEGGEDSEAGSDRGSLALLEPVGIEYRPPPSGPGYAGYIRGRIAEGTDGIRHATVHELQVSAAAARAHQSRHEPWPQGHAEMVDALTHFARTAVEQYGAATIEQSLMLSRQFDAWLDVFSGSPTQFVHKSTGQDLTLAAARERLQKNSEMTGPLQHIVVTSDLQAAEMLRKLGLAP